MKAICVKDVSSLTKGKEYEVIDAGDGAYGLINDNGNLWLAFTNCFRPVPEPVNEWMQVNERVYVNMVTKVVLEFSQYSRSKICVVSIGENNHWEAINQYAEAFAQMVGYKWEE